jgi:hypothetical protein
MQAIKRRKMVGGVGVDLQKYKTFLENWKSISREGGGGKGELIKFRVYSGRVPAMTAYSSLDPMITIIARTILNLYLA